MRLAILILNAMAVVACSWDYPIWIPRSASADPMYRFIRNGRAGYIDGSGRIVIPPGLPAFGNSGSEFHDGLLEIGVSDGKYVDRTGKVVIDKGLYRGWEFSEGFAVAAKKDENLWGYIDTSGEFVIKPQFAWGPNDYVWSFRDGLAKIKVKGKFGYIDRTGRFVIQPELLDGTDFSDGMARVVAEGPCIYFPDGPCASPQRVGGSLNGPDASCKFTYVDKAGRVISLTRFDAARSFSEGLAPVKIGAFWGFIDKTGTMVLSPGFDDAEPFSSGLAKIQQRGLYGYVDKSGTIRIPAQYSYAESFAEGFAVVGDGRGRYRYIDRQGKQTIPGNFLAASPFFKGLAHVKLPSTNVAAEEGFAYINAKGRRVFVY